MARGPVHIFATKKVLRRDVTRHEAADLLWMLVDPTTYHRLVHERGWSDARFQRWLAETMRTQLLVPRNTDQQHAMSVMPVLNRPNRRG